MTEMDGENILQRVKEKFLETTTTINLEAGKIYYLKAKPAMFGAYTLVKMDTAVGKAEVSTTSFYQPK